MKDATIDSLSGWFAGRLPDGWFLAAPRVSQEGEQVKVIGELAAPALAEGAGDEVRRGAEAGRIARFREETRRYRMWIAREAEHRFEIQVQWGATAGGTTTEFNPGGSGRGERKAEASEARHVEI